MVTDNEVLEFFRGELSLAVTFTFKPIPIELDTPLQGYAEWDELPYAIDDFGEKYNVDVSVIDFEAYYPWERESVYRKWFTKEPIKQVSKPLTVRMFAESARAGRWLYD
ncbi:DUF1493 family protein [Citrobacter braakii]|jgi:hypothetical protein|uniref:Cytoplasmic protein n=1 Tax=Citrobacter braakii TaxID=57706 RepID=A0AA44LFD6_CITBR|nr:MULTISPECIES: DUF1493 family protein [Citrobacter]ASE44239.1 DUF1493 domain-containing protein [Citrobacter braakii]AUV24664.1 DUF1493 domain-containing protein [Citrobacter freundii complex sp. CFNIH3]EIV2908198.1 DUF1493 family protein [Citrobacter braakii]EKW2140012.1 DUF1493 family protein [Citrobacter braakii]ELK6841917.1 DUF1493 family protein [Citrobacter braakii]